MVTGPNSALLWADGDISNAAVTSSGGSAVAIGYGNATLLNVSGATDAAAIVTGTMIGWVSGTDFAALIALGGFLIGSVSSSAGDGVILSEGDIAGSLNVAGDGGLYAYGDITGSHWAGNDLAAFTFGSFNGSLSAGHDVLGATTGGDLLGSIAANNSIGGGMYGGGIRSYGQINANISALNLSSDPDGGAISSVIANGAISGSISAAGSLGSVTSGADIFAMLSAGMMGTLTDWDSSTAGASPPTAPASIVPNLLTQVATAQTQVLSDKTDSYNEFLTLTSDVATAQSDAAGDIATAQSDVVSQTAQAASDAATELSNAQAAAAPQFASSGQAVELANAQSNQNASNAAMSSFDADLSNQTTAHNNAQLAAQRDAASLALKIASSRVQVAIDKGKAAQELSDALTAERNWIGKWTPNFQTIVSSLTDAVNPVKIVRERWQSFSNNWQAMQGLTDEAQLSGVRRYHMIIGAIVAEMVGIKQLVGAFDGADPYTLQKWGTAERVLNGVLGAFSLVTSAVGISAFLSRVTSACGSYHWGSCFVIDTDVARRWSVRPVIATASASGPAPMPFTSESDDSWATTWLVVATGVLAITALRWEKDRRRWKRWQDDLAACFASGQVLDDLWLPDARPVAPSE